MASQIFVRPKLGKKFDVVVFDGAEVNVAELKRKIIVKKRMTTATDFELELYYDQSGASVLNNDETVPKNSRVVFKRVSIKNARKVSKAVALNSIELVGEEAPETGDDALFQTINAISDKYRPGRTHRVSHENQTRAGSLICAPSVAHLAPPKRRLARSSNIQNSSYRVQGNRRPIPLDYVCKRCGAPGHFVQDCPTNGDPRYDIALAPRSKGKPQSMLKYISEEEAKREDLSKNVVKTTRGYALLRTNEADMMKMQNLDYSSLSGIFESEDVPEALKCALCKHLVRESSMPPCCGESACDSCLRTELVARGMACPICGEANVSPETLRSNKGIRKAVEEFLQQSKREEVAGAKLRDAVSDFPEDFESGADAVLVIGRRDQYHDAIRLSDHGRKIPQSSYNLEATQPSFAHERDLLESGGGRTTSKNIPMWKQTAPRGRSRSALENRESHRDRSRSRDKYRQALRPTTPV